MVLGYLLLTSVSTRALHAQIVVLLNGWRMKVRDVGGLILRQRLDHIVN